MTTETALNIVAGMEVALVHVGSWDCTYRKYRVQKVLKNNRFRLKAESGAIVDTIWTASHCYPSFWGNERRPPAHEWEARTNNEYYRRDRVVPWDASVERALADKAEMIRRKEKITKIQERVAKLHYTQPALIERLLVALGEVE